MEGGSTFDEVVDQAMTVADAGANLVNTGIGWHEARIFPPGTALMFDRSKTDTRITVDTDRFGKVCRFRQG